MITLARASLAASASAAMALCSCSGKRASLLCEEKVREKRRNIRVLPHISTLSTLMPQAFVASSRMVWDGFFIKIFSRHRNADLHGVGDAVPVAQNLVKILCPKNVSE